MSVHVHLHTCARAWGYLQSSQPTGTDEGRGDTDAMRWHVPRGGFGVVVILLFCAPLPLRHSHSPHYSNVSL